jgi:cell division septal protein FtsQ
VSGSRAAAAGRRAHPAVAARRRQIARARGRRRRSGLLLGAGMLLALALLWWLANGPLLAVTGVSVRGYDRPDRAALIAAIDDAASGGTVVSPPAGRIRSTAAAFPWVASVAVQRDWPRGVTVDVVMARPAAVAAVPGGEPALVSDAGRVLGPAPEAAGLGWLRLTRAPPAAGYALPAADRAGLAFLAAAQPAVAARVRQLGADASGALSARIDGGPELRLGRPERMEAKARALALVLAQVPPGEIAEASYIDLRIPKRPAIGGLAVEAPAEDETANASEVAADTIE